MQRGGKGLEEKLAINRSNSYKSPSKDDFKPPKAWKLRKKTNKKLGSQASNKSHSDKLKDNPDETINYLVGGLSRM